jgi:hypothetical protein
MGIGDILLERGVIRPEHLAEALAMRKSQGMRLDKALVELGYVSELQVLEVMSEQLGMPLVDLQSIKVDGDAVRMVPAKIVFRKHLVPIEKINGTPSSCTPSTRSTC